MQTQSSTNAISTGALALDLLRTNEIATIIGNSSDEFKNFFQQLRLPWLDDLLTKLTTQAGKKSFLVFKNNKYFNVPTENIAYFYIRYESAVLVCFDKQEFFV